MSGLNWPNMVIWVLGGLTVIMVLIVVCGAYLEKRMYRADMKRLRWKYSVWEVMSELGPQVPKDVLAREVELKMRAYEQDNDNSAGLDWTSALTSVLLVASCCGLAWGALFADPTHPKPGWFWIAVSPGLIIFILTLWAEVVGRWIGRRRARTLPHAED